MHALMWGRSDGGARIARLPRRVADALARVGAGLLVGLWVLGPWVSEAVRLEEPAGQATEAALEAARTEAAFREILIAGYAGAPLYYRSDVRLARPDGTDLVLKRLGWDGDALYFPIDGGIRSVEWWGGLGFMIDFLHNKAIARLGKGAHGRRLADPVVEEVEATGTIAGQAAPPRIKLTDVVERLEFTHGHNMLFLTPLVRTGSLSPRARPYFGLGAGFALPHVEVWFTGAGREQRTNEYQLAGPATQMLVGLELRTGRLSYFVEYKFSFAWIWGALTGDQSWLNFNMPGDLWRQLSRWWRGEAPRYGAFSTRLGAHQIVIGAGYWLRWPRPAR